MLKKITRILALLLSLALVLVGCKKNAEPIKAPANEVSTKITIGFAVSTLGNDFFVFMADSGTTKAKELAIDFLTLDAQDSTETQATQIEDLITKEVDLLIINPVDSDAVGASVILANKANIPVITISRPSNSGEVVQHLDIDNKEAGRLIAQQMNKDLNGKGKIAILEGKSGAPSAVDRQAGFIETIEKEAPDIEVLSSLTANYSREEAAAVMEDLLQSQPELDAIYAHNDEMALGAVRSVIAANRLDKIKIYGVDATEDALSAIKKGEMVATVQQQPDVQIYTALESALKILNDETVEKRINIPLKLITE